jgi:hypothetical protein
VLLAVTILGSCVLQNPHKRLLVRPGEAPAFRMSRAEQLALSRPAFDKVLQTFDRHVAGTAPIAFVGVANDWDSAAIWSDACTASTAPAISAPDGGYACAPPYFRPAARLGRFDRFRSASDGRS